MADLATFDTSGANEGAVFTFLDPRSGDPFLIEDKPVTLTVLGYDSDRAVAARRANDLRRLKATRRAGEIDFDLEEELELSFLAACTTGWENVVLNGEHLELNTGNVKRVLALIPALRGQVAAFINNRVNFYKAA